MSFGPFLGRFIVYSALLAVLLILTGIVLAAYAQASREREWKRRKKSTHS